MRAGVLLAQQAGDSGPGAVAIVGAVTGVAALLLSLVRALSDRARLHVEFSTYVEVDWEAEERVVPVITVVNRGRLPAFITAAYTTPTLPTVWRWPVLRRLSSRKQRRLAVVLRRFRVDLDMTRIPAEDLPRRIDPGELLDWELPSDFPSSYQLIARGSS